MTLIRATLMLIVLSATILGLTTAPVTAQEKMADSRVQVVTKVDVVRLDDVEGHTTATFENKGYNLKTGSWTVNRGTSDLIKGNGTARGYTTTHYSDGAVSYSSWEGKTTTVVVDGKSIGDLGNAEAFTQGPRTCALLIEPLGWHGFDQIGFAVLERESGQMPPHRAVLQRGAVPEPGGNRGQAPAGKRPPDRLPAGRREPDQ